MANVLRIHPSDTVATAVRDLTPGERLEIAEGTAPIDVVTVEDVPFGHKVAIASIAAGEHVIKYGASIGVATQDIAPGQHVHSHNLTSVRGAVKS